MLEYREARFIIDSIPSAEYLGYSDSTDWNGFARPLFEHAVAIKVLRDSEANGFAWSYQEDIDAFVVTYEHQPDDDAEEFTGMIIRIDNVDKKVYGIGSGSWIWEESGTA